MGEARRDAARKTGSFGIGRATRVRAKIVKVDSETRRSRSRIPEAKGSGRKSERESIEGEGRECSRCKEEKERGG